MSDLNIEVSGDVAFGRSLQRVSGVHLPGRKALHYTVRVTDAYRKVRGE